MNERTRAVMLELERRNPVPDRAAAAPAAAAQAQLLFERVVQMARTGPAGGGAPAGGSLLARPHRPYRRNGRRRAKIAVIAVGTATAAGVVSAVVAGSGVPGTPLHPDAAAAAVLTRAAEVARAQAPGAVPGPGQYLYVEMLEANEGGIGSGSSGSNEYSFVDTDTQQIWVDPQGSGRDVITPGSDVWFLSPADRAAWAASGTPLPTPAGSDQSFSNRPDWFPDTADLPTDPSQLEQAIADQDNGGVLDPPVIFQLAGTFLQWDAAPPVRAALYEMLEQMPGVESLGPMTDVLGRRGVAVGLTGGGVQTQLIFDPATSAVLEERRVVVSPDATSGQAPDVNDPNGPPVGTVLGYTVFVERGVVDSLTGTPSVATPSVGTPSVGTTAGTLTPTAGSLMPGASAGG